MVQGGEDLALVAETADHELGVHAAADHLDGRRVLELVGAPAQVDRTHAAASQALLDQVGADLEAEVGIRIGGVKG